MDYRPNSRGRWWGHASATFVSGVRDSSVLSGPLALHTDGQKEALRSPCVPMSTCQGQHRRFMRVEESSQEVRLRQE
jgi:hypothetical protein